MISAAVLALLTSCTYQSPGATSRRVYEDAVANETRVLDDIGEQRYGIHESYIEEQYMCIKPGFLSETRRRKYHAETKNFDTSSRRRRPSEQRTAAIDPSGCIMRLSGDTWGGNQQMTWVLKGPELAKLDPRGQGLFSFPKGITNYVCWGEMCRKRPCGITRTAG